MQKQLSKQCLKAVCKGLFMGLLLLFCMALAAQETSPPPAGTALNLDDLRTFTDVFNQVRKNYVESVDDKQLMEAAITGMLSELDPHSAYLPGDDYEDLDHSSRGEYVGVGVDVAAENGRVIVRKVLVPSPADSAGINPGDVFTSIAGKAVKGRKLQEAINDRSPQARLNDPKEWVAASGHPESALPAQPATGLRPCFSCCVPPG